MRKLLILSLLLAFSLTFYGQRLPGVVSASGAVIPDPYGAELIVNGTFNSNINGWAQAGTDWVWESDGAGGGRCRRTTMGTANAISQVILTAGKTYHVVYTVGLRTAGSIFAQCGWDGGGGTLRSTNATFTQDIVCSGIETTFFFDTGNWDTYLFDGWIDDVSVKEVL